MRVSVRAVANNNVINYYKFQLPIILRKYLRCNYCNVFGLSASWNIMLYSSQIDNNCQNNIITVTGKCRSIFMWWKIKKKNCL